MLKVVQELSEPTRAGRSLLDEIVCVGARQMLAAEFRAEVAAYAQADVVDDAGAGCW